MCTEVYDLKTGALLPFYGVIHHYHLAFDFDAPAEYNVAQMKSWVWRCYDGDEITKKDAESVFYFCHIMLWVLYLAGSDAVERYEATCKEKRRYLCPLMWLENNGWNNYVNEPWTLRVWALVRKSDTPWFEVTRKNFGFMMTTFAQSLPLGHNPKFKAIRHSDGYYVWSRHYQSKDPQFQRYTRENKDQQAELELQREPVGLILRDLSLVLNQSKLLGWFMKV